MKTIYACIILVFSVNFSYSQCLENGDFAQYCGTNANSLCGTSTVSFFQQPAPVSTQCVANWYTSHGTPQLFMPGPTSQNNYAYMWYNSNVNGMGPKGEGIFSNYNFLANHSYTVSIRILASDATGTYYIYAANGLVQSNTSASSCGQGIPSIPDKELIRQSAETNINTWQTYTFSFTPTSNFSQLWVYPYTPSTSVQYNFNVDYITICPECATNHIYYNNGTIPTGITQAGYIHVGSSAGSGGSGTVSNNPAIATTLSAFQYIEFLPNMVATAFGSGYFLAEISPCGSGATRLNNIDQSERNIDVSRFFKYQDNFDTDDIVKKSEIKIYPSPSKDKITISSDFKNIQNSEITVFDQSGRQVLKTQVNSGSNLYTLNLNKLNNGIYIIQIKNNQEIITKKIVLNK